MSGPSAIKGYLLQTIICILETLENNTKQNKIVEGEREGEYFHLG